MKTKFVLAGLVATLMVLEVSAQRAEYDDMYFTAKDREKNKAIDADESFQPTKSKKQKNQELLAMEEDNSNPTDSYSARNVNPEYISRENSEQASEDETNYYVEGYTPAATTNLDYNNSYYNNANWARNSYFMNSGYMNSGWNSPYGMSPYYPGGYYDPYMMPAYGSYGFGSSYGWRTGWSVSFMYGNYGNPWGGYGMYNPYYGYGGYPAYYYGGGNYYAGGPTHYYEGSRPNYAKRPSRHSAVVTPTQRNPTRVRTANATTNNAATNVSRARARQPVQQDEYYVRPSRRTAVFDNPAARPSNGANSNRGSLFSNPDSQPSRSRDYSQPRESRPSYNPPSSSPSPSRSSGGSSGGGGSSPRPRGRN